VTKLKAHKTPIPVKRDVVWVMVTRLWKGEGKIKKRALRMQAARSRGRLKARYQKKWQQYGQRSQDPEHLGAD